MNLDKLGRDALFYAITDKDEEALRLLDDCKNINFRDLNGFSYLHAAVQNRNLAVTEKLITMGCKIDISDSYGRTPLMIAISCYNGDDTIIRLLIDSGADIHITAKSGVSCLKLAEMKGYPLSG